MGVIIDKFCCIDTNEVLENTNFNHSINNNSLDRENTMNYTQFPSSALKSLPKSEITMNTSRGPKVKINSLSKLPISTKNVIRKQLGHPFENYEIIKKLGNGTFGQVFKVVHKQTGVIRAMKIIPKNNLKPGFTDKDIIREINIMKSLEHPHVIKLYEFYIDEYNYYLLNEFCTEGDLSEKINKLKYLPEPIVKIIMVQIFNAVLYLNDRGIIHGDLKLENILVDSYLDNGIRNIKAELRNNSFISSLIQDAKDVKNYLKNNQIRRTSTVTNLKKFNFQEKEMENPKKNINNDKEKLIPKKVFLRHTSTIQMDILSLQKFKSEPEFMNFKGGKKNNSNKKEEKKDNSEEERIQEISQFKMEDSSFTESDDTHKSPSPKRRGNLKTIQNEKSNKKGLIKQLSIITEENKEECKEEYQDKEEQKPNQFGSTIKRKTTYNYSSLKIKNFELKLIDFGCSKIFSQHKKTFEDTIGTLVYCSPEVLKNNYNQKCDIWSCGVIMYILLSGKYPFYGKTESEINKKILLGNFDFNDKHFDNISESAKDLIRKCLIKDKNKRITVQQALKHRFFSDEINVNDIFGDEIDTKNILKKLKNSSKNKSKFYQTVLTYLSHNFAEKDELKKLRKIFYKIDLNLDGKISKEELYIAYKEAGMNLTKQELNKIMDSIDFDGNGSIEYEEFIRVTLPKEKLFTDVNLKNAFDMFDIDKNGSISLNEILEVIGVDKEIDKSVIEELKAEILKDGDEEIDFPHFKEIMLGFKS